MRKENSKAIILFLAGVICFLVVFILLQSVSNSRSDTHQDNFETVETADISNRQNIGDTKTENRVVVYITGAVVSPGVYELSPDSRLCDAVSIAGGFSDNADKNSVNLALPLKDGEHLHVHERN